MNYGKMDQLFRALIRSDMALYEELGRQLQNERWPEAARFGVATFYTAVLRRFRIGQPIPDVVSYVADLRSRLPSDDEMDAHQIELMIRRILHDDVSVANIPGPQRIDIQNIVIYDIVSNENLSDEDLDLFFEDVKKILHENTPVK